MALTGTIHGTTCYSSLPEAYQAHFSELMPVTLSTGELISYEFLTGVWKRVSTTYKTVGGVTTPTVTTSVASLPNLSPCDPQLGFQDGLSFALVVVGLIASASFYGIISRAK